MARGDGLVRKRTYQRKSGTATRWLARLDLGPGRDAQGRRQQRVLEERQFPTRDAAKEWLAKRRAELRLGRVGTDRRSGKLTVADLLEAYVEHGTTLGDWSPGHTRRTRQIVDGDLAPLHEIPVEEITVADVEALVQARQRDGASANTIRLMRNALSAALNLAIRRELVPPWSNVAARASTPAVRREQPRFVPPHLIPAFLDGLEGERYRSLIVTAMTLALRPSEAVGLRWRDVDLEEGLVTVSGSLQAVDGRYEQRDRPKDDEPRSIALPAFLADMLREHRRDQLEERQSDYAPAVLPPARTEAQQRRAQLVQRRHDERRQRRAENEARWPGLVFTGRDGGPVHEPAVNRRLKTIIGRINDERSGRAEIGTVVEKLPVVTFYQLRHTGATWMLSTGVPEHELQAIMGHSSPAMTRRYAAVLEPQRRAAADRLDAFLESASGALGGRSGGRGLDPAAASGA